MAKFERTDVDGMKLEASAGKIANELQTVKNSFNTVERILEQLDGSWDGAANDAFMDRRHKDRELITKTVQAALELNDRLINAARNYEKADDIVRQTAIKAL